jgi:hypothetical protein
MSWRFDMRNSGGTIMASPVAIAAPETGDYCCAKSALWNSMRLITRSGVGSADPDSELEIHHQPLEGSAIRKCGNI